MMVSARVPDFGKSSQNPYLARRRRTKNFGRKGHLLMKMPHYLVSWEPSAGSSVGVASSLPLLLPVLLLLLLLLLLLPVLMVGTGRESGGASGGARKGSGPKPKMDAASIEKRMKRQAGKARTAKIKAFVAREEERSARRRSGTRPCVRKTRTRPCVCAGNMAASVLPISRWQQGRPLRQLQLLAAAAAPNSGSLLSFFRKSSAE